MLDTKKTSNKSMRTRAREFAVQGLYQHLVGRNPVDDIDPFTRDLAGFRRADAEHFETLLHGCIRESEALDLLILPHLDRKLAEISPIERAVMWIGVYEFLHCPDVPWRVALNECIELGKSFGGTDGHKYVNAVLCRVAPKVRPHEVAADPGRPTARGRPTDEALDPSTTPS